MGSEAKWTPGPWVWRQNGGNWLLWGEHGMRPIVLDTARRAARLRVRDTNDLMVSFYPEHPDAALIAAAPLLAEALERIAQGDFGPVPDDILAQGSAARLYEWKCQQARECARAALAAATPETQERSS